MSFTTTSSTPYPCWPGTTSCPKAKTRLEYVSERRGCSNWHRMNIVNSSDIMFRSKWTSKITKRASFRHLKSNFQGPDFSAVSVAWLEMVHQLQRGHRPMVVDVTNVCTEESNVDLAITVGKAIDEPATSLQYQDEKPEKPAKLHRDVIGIGILTVFLAPWHMLPVFTDMKIAEDPLLPGLTSTTLPFSSTAIFCGWLVGSVGMKRVMETFSNEQLIVAANSGLLLVTLCMVTLPYLTRGNLVLFIAVRFVYGLLMNIKPMQLMYIQDRVPAAHFTQALVFQYCAYTLVAVAMAGLCGSLTYSMSWTTEVVLWCGLSRLVGLWVAFPNAWQILQSLPETLRRREETSSEESPTQLTGAARRTAGLLVVCFIACGTGFYGLTYSAGQLSSNLYLSSMLLYSIDIVGYLFATGANLVGKKSIQLWSFLLASFCLFLCGTGEPGSRFVLIFALIGRLGVDVCFATNYLVLAEAFAEPDRVHVLPACEAAARLGSILAPFVGTLPTTLSCPFFGVICFAAGCATLNLPDGHNV